METDKRHTLALDCLNDDERDTALSLAKALKCLDRIVRREGLLDISLPIAQLEVAEALSRFAFSRGRQIDPYYVPCLALELGVEKLLPGLLDLPSQETGKDGSLFSNLK